MLPTLCFELKAPNKGAGNVLYLNLAGVLVSIYFKNESGKLRICVFYINSL